MEEVMTLQEAVDTLNFPTWEWVGATLLSMGITDEEESDLVYSYRCPIAVYLHRLGIVDARVGSYNAFSDKSLTVHASLPAAAIEFIEYYDSASVYA